MRLRKNTEGRSVSRKGVVVGPPLLVTSRTMEERYMYMIRFFNESCRHEWMYEHELGSCKTAGADEACFECQDRFTCYTQ